MTLLTRQDEHQETETIAFSTEELFRLKKVADKRKQATFDIAFCGHFSAGKSTMLNTLLGAELLPTSPIPASANTIAIQNGGLQLSVHAKNGESKAYKGEIPWEKVREWGMDGRKISSLNIFAPLPFLGKCGRIIDTPGVDSTDSTHAAVTTEQLYTTDVIVYIMDYNHVQSETNLYFLKQLSDEKKPLFLVINQVDKHNEDEIAFSAFRESIEELLRRWEIDYLAMYFTSMKKPDHRNNEFLQLERALKSLLHRSSMLISNAQHFLEYSFYRSIENRLQQEEQEQRDTIAQEWKEKTGYDVAEFAAAHRQASEKMQQLRTYDDILRKNFHDEFNGLFANVTLFPYSTTELARKWIESLQPGFKAGLLFSRKKTAEEQDKRLENLVMELQDKVKTQLLFHLQSYFQQTNRLTLANEEEFDAALKALSFQVTGDFLKSHVKKELTGRDYVYVFTHQITSLIVKEIRRKAAVLLEVQIAGMRDDIAQQHRQLEVKYDVFLQAKSCLAELEHVEEKYAKLRQHVKDILRQHPSANEWKQLINEAMQGTFPEYPEVSRSFSISHEVKKPEKTQPWTGKVESAPDSFSEEKALEKMRHIKKVLLDYHASPLLATDRTQLINRIDRYEQRTFIVSLFGGFSAGKSSFANALLGEDILPVSPNPTTAAVNIVEKSCPGHAHGTATVTLKSPQQLSAEINAAGERLGVTLDLEQLPRWKGQREGYSSSGQKTAVEYLLTVRDSLATTALTLGEELTVSHRELAGWIAEEVNACLVEKVTIYYDCPLTERGIKLVDTPGINSIHGRHTNVAMKQLKESDAIFYLTYYNHAFSKTDQYFLQQIGQVNESFQQDKLYFVINAADLADNDSELQEVKNHVTDQLKGNGIENPRLHHVSSREGLQAKQTGHDEATAFTAFEQTFHHETIVELKRLAWTLLNRELRQYCEKINDSILLMSSEAKERAEQRPLLEHKIAQLTKLVESASFHSVRRDSQLELEQLLLYLKERMKMVMSDDFTSAVNVAVITSDRKKQLQQQFDQAVEEWRSSGEQFLTQELAAVAIRMEECIRQSLERWLAQEAAKITAQLPYIFYDQIVKMQPLATGDFPVRFLIDPSQFHPHIKSKKQFFEEGKIKQVREALINDGVNKVAEVIAQFSQSFVRQVDDLLVTMENELKQRLQVAIYQELERFDALADQRNHQSLVDELQALQQAAE
ncbi:Dynamin family protein [Evansella caseinilytica]|uniref:Dynamin family protein n=1 Tax=Evansella caseinilytica TaxID=1503961 RepID=A0A1H3P022_9BACI|nr:dynamin family protein [Evansella caseinilytica]SDY94484.1 Dynamin family protein [Evansella caseinilytica]